MDELPFTALQYQMGAAGQWIGLAPNNSDTQALLASMDALCVVKRALVPALAMQTLYGLASTLTAAVRALLRRYPAVNLLDLFNVTQLAAMGFAVNSVNWAIPSFRWVPRSIASACATLQLPMTCG